MHNKSDKRQSRIQYTAPAYNKNLFYSHSNNTTNDLNVKIQILII